MDFLEAVQRRLLQHWGEIKRRFTIFVWVAWIVLGASAGFAGPFAPSADILGTTAIPMDDPAFVAWAAQAAEYLPGSNVDETWKDPDKALGQAQGTSFDIVSLGRGGQITLVFDPPIQNGDGWDFAVFENSFRDTFLELAYVEVSSDGQIFVRFDSSSLTPGPVPGFGSIDPTDIDGLAGKYRQGFGTPFDLAELADKAEVIDGLVDLNAIGYVRLVDIVGDGTFLDSSGAVIYDPYPTDGSAGFDLDAVGVSNGAAYPEGEYIPPPTPTEDVEAGVGGDVGCFISSIR